MCGKRQAINYGEIAAVLSQEECGEMPTKEGDRVSGKDSDPVEGQQDSAPNPDDSKGKGGDGDRVSGGDGKGDGKGKQPSVEELTAQLEELRATLEESERGRKHANNESAQRRKQLEALQTQLDERKQAAMSDLEKAQAAAKRAEARAQELQGQLRALTLRHAVEAAAGKLNFVDPADAYALADMAQITIDEETGAVEGVEAVLTKLAKAKPHLIKREEKKGAPPDIDADKGGGSNRPQDAAARRADIARRFGLRGD